MRTRRIVRLAGAMVVAATLIPTVAASAEDDRDPHTGHETLDSRAATSADARIVAQQRDWKPELAMKHLEESRRFTDLAATLAEKYPRSYAGAQFAERPGQPSVVRLVADPPQEALELIEQSRLAIKVDDGARYSEKALQKRAKAVHEHLVGSGFKQVVSATTPSDGVEATVFGKGEVKLPRALREGVEVSRSREPIVSNEHTRGGAPLFDDGVFECTSGFSVVHDNGTTGVATAAHCNGLNQYRQPSNGLTYDMDFQDQHNGLFGDMEWHTTNHIEPAEYFARANEVREVNSVDGYLPVNTPSCVYGRSSNQRACDNVYSNFVTVTINGTTNWFLMAMDNDNTIPGDSGGPWGFATIADGIHKGDVTLGGGRRNMWSRADLLPIALDVSVRTQ